MISDIRSYIVGQINQVDSDLKQNTSPFYNGDIGENIIDRSYQIQFGQYNNTFRTDYREDALDCTISIFGYGYRDENSNFDELFDKAVCIRDRLIDIKNFFGQNLIVNVESTTIVPSQLDTDENGYRFDINTIFNIAYIREE